MALMDEDEGRRPMVLRIVWALCLVLAIGLSIWGVLRVSAARESHDQLMADLSAEHEEAEETYRRSSVSEVHDETETAKRLDAARAAAEKLAEAETGYQSVSGQDVTSYAQEKLDALFSDDVSSSDRRWMSRLRTPYTWKAVPCVMIDAYSVPCAWTCEVDGKFMGYVTARFDPATGKFGDVQRVLSNLVRKYYGAEGSSDAVDSGVSDEASSKDASGTSDQGNTATAPVEQASVTDGKADGDAFSR